MRQMYAVRIKESFIIENSIGKKYVIYIDDQSELYDSDLEKMTDLDAQKVKEQCLYNIGY